MVSQKLTDHKRNCKTYFSILPKYVLIVSTSCSLMDSLFCLWSHSVRIGWQWLCFAYHCRIMVALRANWLAMVVLRTPLVGYGCTSCELVVQWLPLRSNHWLLFCWLGWLGCHISPFGGQAISPKGQSVSPFTTCKPFSFIDEKGFNV